MKLRPTSVSFLPSGRLTVYILLPVYTVVPSIKSSTAYLSIYYLSKPLLFKYGTAKCTLVLFLIGILLQLHATYNNLYLHTYVGIYTKS
jgi:hypothetical protein